MKKDDLELFAANLCADEINQLLSILNKNLNINATSADSNNKIIQRERKLTCCPHCGSTHIVKNGKTKNRKQKYLCRDCNQSFSDTNNTILYHTRKPYQIWYNYLKCLLQKMTLSDTAKEVGISQTSAFVWRHKLLETLNLYHNDVKLEGIIQADGIFLPINLKGTKPKNMPRRSKLRTNSASRGISKHKICVITAEDDFDTMMFQVAGLGPESSKMLLNYKDKFKKGSLLITDSKPSYIEFAKQTGLQLDQIPSGFHKSNIGNDMAALGGLQSEIRTWLTSFRGVSTRHLQGYLNLFKYLKYLKYKVEYSERVNRSYCDSVPVKTTLYTESIYKKAFPIDLKEAYGEYHYGIFS